MTRASSYSSFSPSSSSPTKTKTTKFSQKKPNSSSSESTRLTKRQETVFKKAYELSILCGIEVCVICYGPDGELKTWPKDREKVKDMARKYIELSETKRRKRSVGLGEFLEKINKGGSEKKTKVRLGSKFKYPDWDPKFDDYSVEQLTELIQSLERNHIRIQHRARVVVEAQKQRKMQNTNMADQEQRMTIATTNHVQQHSNQVSMYLFNHGNGTLTQIPASASAFNQAQSLAPIPSSLKIYPNLNVENYSYSTFPGVQETGINEFQNANMYSCNNMNVEEYLGLLGVQTEFNGFQNMNMNMCGYNDNSNTNGLSHQLVQFPPQNIKSLYDI